MDAIQRTEILHRVGRFTKELLRRCARRKLLDFGQWVFPEVEKGKDYERTWFNRVIADELHEWMQDPEAPFLMVWAPPRHGKSQIISRFLASFILGQDPNAQIIGTSYGQDYANKISREIQRIMLSRAYQELFPKSGLPRTGTQGETEKRSVGEFEILGHRGSYIGRGVGGGVTGRGANYIIIDDPIKNRADAESETYREAVWEWYKSTIRTRLEKDGKIVLVLTRWHEDDLAGRLLDKMEKDPEADKWKVVSFPAFFEKSPYTHPKDKRKPGEALWPARFTKKYLLKTKATLGTYDWSALYQQRPLPPGGAVIKREWLTQIIKKAPRGLHWKRFWDLAVTTKKRSNHSASPQGALDRNQNFFIRGMIRGKWIWPNVRKILIMAANREQVPVGVESSSTQVGFVQDLQQDKELKGIAITGYNPPTDKLTRALPWIAKAEAGKMYIIDGHWVDDFVDECVHFTGKDDKEDDQVDAVSGVYQMLTEGKAGAFGDIGHMY